jgi:fructosamine-3-kinase
MGFVFGYHILLKQSQKLCPAGFQGQQEMDLAMDLEDLFPSFPGGHLKNYISVSHFQGCLVRVAHFYHLF